MENRYYTTNDVAKMFNVSTTTVIRDTKRYNIPIEKIKKGSRIDRRYDTEAVSLLSAKKGISINRKKHNTTILKPIKDIGDLYNDVRITKYKDGYFINEYALDQLISKINEIVHHINNIEPK